MRVATFNTNSIRARLSVILKWLDTHHPDALFLQETKVQDSDFPAESFEEAGYQAVARGQKTYNGVAIITKKALRNTRVDLHDETDEEARFACGDLDGVHLINVYVPQGFAVGSERFVDKLAWLTDLVEYIRDAYTPETPLVMAGDFNVALEPVDVYDPEGLEGQVGYNPDEQTIMKELLNWGLVDLLRRHHPEGAYYTFWDYRIPNGFKRNMGWRIDYILATAPLAKRSTDVWIDTEVRAEKRPSDHTFLVAEFSPES